MIRRPPRSKRTDTLFPYTTLFRSWNETNEERVVLLLDFNRPMRLGGRLVTWLFFQIMKLTAFYQEPKRNIRDFESRLEGAAKRANENLERNASAPAPDRQTRSEARRVGKECVRTCRYGWSPSQ